MSILDTMEFNFDDMSFMAWKEETDPRMRVIHICRYRSEFEVGRIKIVFDTSSTEFLVIQEIIDPLYAEVISKIADRINQSGKALA